jgi:PAS domain S-box-containing protein
MNILRHSFRSFAGISAVIAAILLIFTISAGASFRSISVAYCKDAVPFHFTDENNKPAGIIIDLWRIWSEKTGIAIDFKEASWDETLKMVGSGKADVHAGLFFNKERDKFLDYGVAFTKTDTHYFTHATLPPIRKIKDLSAYRVGVLNGDYVEKYLKERLPEGNVVPFPDYTAIMNALQQGMIRVFAADTPTGLFHLEKSGLLSEFSFVSEKPLYRNDWFAAVQEGNKELIEVVNNGIALITDEEKRDINRRWISSGKEKSKALIISIDRAYAPLSFINTLGKPSGFFVDMWRAWAKKTGQPIKFRATSWAETLEGLRAGEADIHSGLSFSRERAEWIDFSTRIYETFSRVYHGAGEVQPAVIGAYGTDAVGTMFGSYQEAEFRKTYPDVSVRSYTSNQELIDALLKNEIKAIVQEEPIMDATLDRLGLRGDIIARPEKLFPSTIHAGVKKGNTDLLKKINQGFSAIPVKEMVTLEKRWLSDSIIHFYRTDKKPVIFSEKEEDWLNDHLIINFAVTNFLPPIDIVNDKKQYTGLNADLIKILNKKLSINIVPIFFDKWDEVVDHATSGKVDGALSFSITPERKKHMLFTPPYAHDSIITVVTEDNKQITHPGDIRGKRVSVTKGLAVMEKVTARIGKTGKIFEFDDEIDALKALAEGKTDAHISSLIMFGNSQKKEFIPNLRIAARENIEGGALRIAIHKNNPLLFSVIQKGLDSITRTEMAELRNKWLSPNIQTRENNQISLNEKEAAWLVNNSKIRLGIDPSWAPFEFVNEKGDYSGISSGYVDEVVNRVQLEMTPVKDITWSQVIEKAKAGDIDVLPAVMFSKDRAKYLNFSKPYISLPVIIAIHKELLYVDSLKDLAGHRIGVVKDYFIEETLKRDYPNLELFSFSSVEEGLLNLDEGKLGAFVDTLGSITHEINQSGLYNIKISAPTNYKLDLAFGVRKDWPELVSILNKVIHGMSAEKKMLIKNTWMAPVEVKFGINLKRIMKWAIPISVSIILIFLFGFIWNRRLSKEVIERKKAQQEHKTSERKISAMSRAMDEALVMIDYKGIVSFWNPAAEKLFGYKADEAMGLDFHSIATPPEIRKKAKSGLIHFAKTGKGPILGSTLETTALNRSGKTFPVEVMLSPFQIDENWFAVGTIRDITERKKSEKALKDSEENLRRILDSINTAIIQIDPEERIIVDLNPIAETMIGLPRKKILGQRCHQFICPAKDHDCPILDQGKVIDNTERILISAQGKEIPVLKTVVSVNLGGKHYLIESFVDLTERKQIEEALKKSEQQVKTILESAAEGFWQIDNNGKTIEVNPIMCDLIGRKQDQIIGRTILDFVDEQGKEIISDQHDFQKKDHTGAYDIALVKPDGSKVHCLFNATLLYDSKGNKSGSFAMVTDFTDRKKAETELKQLVEDLERFNNITISREERMIELKDENNHLLEQMGKEKKYKVH